jgi:hypothetical protein
MHIASIDIAVLLYTHPVGHASVPVQHGYRAMQEPQKGRLSPMKGDGTGNDVPGMLWTRLVA